MTSGSAAGDTPRHELSRGYTIARVINGGWQLSAGHRPKAVGTEATLAGLLDLVDAGFTTFDCGDIYVGVEELLGQLVKRHATRDTAAALPIQVHTKFVPDRDALAVIDKTHVEQIIDRSLQRLGVERLDLVQFAWWDYTVPRYVETAVWLDELRQAGKIHLLGATNFDVPRLREIVEAGVPLCSHQVQYSLLDRRPERGMVRFCQERNIQLLGYGSLAGGFLSDRYLRAPEPVPPFANRSLVKYRLIIDEFGGWDRFQKLLRCLDTLAVRHGVSIANVAVGWVLDQDSVAAAIVGAANASRLDDNRRVFGLRLDDKDRQQLVPFDNAGPAGDVYSIERVLDGPHAAIMKYNLNRDATD